MKPCIKLWSEQSPEPVPSHGGPSVGTYWKLAIEGVIVGREYDRRHWCADRQKYSEIEYAPRNLVDLFNKLCAAFETQTQEPVATLQSRVQPWMMACFGPEISADKLERSDRFTEEALELLQSVDYPRERVHALIDYVYGRDKGETPQEIGGVMITLAAFCLAHEQDMHEAGEIELARIWTKVEKIRAKQAAKPTGSALPIAAPPPQAVKVRKLEWEDYPLNGEPVISRAIALHGTYFIVDDMDDFTGWYLVLVSHDNAEWWQGVRATSEEFNIGRCIDDMEPLKSAAQADYERRILSAIQQEEESNG